MVFRLFIIMWRVWAIDRGCLASVRVVVRLRGDARAMRGRELRAFAAACLADVSVVRRPLAMDDPRISFVLPSLRWDPDSRLGPRQHGGTHYCCATCTPVITNTVVAYM